MKKQPQFIHQTNMLRAGNDLFKKKKKQQIKLQESSVETYCQIAIKQLKRNPSLYKEFSQSDFQNFQSFYYEYQNEQLFQRDELKQKCQKALKIHNKKDITSLIFQVRVVQSAVYHSTNQYRLRITQLMALYLYLNIPKRTKILMEILTGEGKTTIVSCLAAILYMRGYNVDIVTTNTMLAKRDQSEKGGFYSLLGIPVDNNFPAQKRIVPIDKSTGAHLKQVNWSNGLHQFLQIKHGLAVFPESMTSNFISNIGHFLRYEIIFGLTGTLGSKSSKQFLKETYQAAMIEIPPSFQRKLKNQPGHLMFDHKRWMGQIISRCEQMVKMNRSVLIICQSILQVQVIEFKIKQTFGLQKLPTYISGEEKHSDIICCQQIIIATNIAGRGMDFKLHRELIKNGGLHVIISYMPENLRVQKQARGRAGRNGAPGSSEIIVNHSEYFKSNNIPLLSKQVFENKESENKLIEICFKNRDKRQKLKNQNEKLRVKKIRILDKKFKLFCEATNEIPDFNQNYAKRKAIEEQWSMFLKRCEVLQVDDETFESCADEMIKRFKNESESFYNINHNFQRGYNKVNKGEPQQAEKLFKQLQKQDNSLMQQCGGLFGECYVKGVSLDRQISTKEEKQDVLNILNKSLIKLSERKQIVKGQHLLFNSINNRTMVNLMQGQVKRQQQQLKNAMNRTQLLKSQITFTEIGQNAQKKQQQVIEQQIQIEQLIKNPQLDYLQLIQQKIKTQISTLTKLQNSQVFKVRLEPLRKLIDKQNLNLDNQQQAAFQKVTSQIQLIPVCQITKKKVQFWKRALIFCGGIAQICAGALILSKSSFFLTSFGTGMIVSGIKDCWKAIFTPQICVDLQKFYTDKTIGYAMAMANVGIEGKQQMKKLSSNGFTFFKNSSMSKVINATVQGIKKGLVNSNLDWSYIGKNYLLKGISLKMSSNKVDSKKENELNILTINEIRCKNSYR